MNIEHFLSFPCFLFFMKTRDALINIIGIRHMLLYLGVTVTIILFPRAKGGWEIWGNMFHQSMVAEKNVRKLRSFRL